MTDITELAQREKFEAWAEEGNALPWGYLKKRRIYTGFYSEHTYTSLWAAWKAAGAELVEALKKAQTKAIEQGRTSCELFDEVTALRQRIAELESRSVKLPSELELRNNEVCSVCAGNALQVIEDKLTAAGIKWEAE